MTKKQQIAKDALERRLQNFEKQKLQDKEALATEKQILAAQIHKTQEVNLITLFEMNQYLTRLNELYLFHLRKQGWEQDEKTKKNNIPKQGNNIAAKSMSEWERIMNNNAGDTGCSAKLKEPPQKDRFAEKELDVQDAK